MMDGLNVHGAIIDELHAHPNRGVWDALRTAQGARRQPLVFAITTAGYDRDSICWEVRDYSIKVLDRTFDDDSRFAYIATKACGTRHRRDRTACH
jgi:phage terminase large subunit-like protein